MQDIDPTLLFPFSSKEKNTTTFPGRSRVLWIEDIFFDSRNLDAATSGAQYVGNHFTEKKSLWLVVSMLVMMLGIFIRLLHIQVVQGEDNFRAAEGNRQRIRPIAAERGLIYDAKNRQLVKNIPNFHLALVPQDLPRDKEKLERVIASLSQLTKQSIQEISEIINEYKHYRFESVVIKEDLDYETALAIYIASTELPGVFIEQGSKRLYFNSLGVLESTTSTVTSKEDIPTSLAHIVGYQGKLDPDELESLYEVGYLPSDSIGKSGVEKTYEEQLRGSYGQRRVEVNAGGILQKTLAEEPATPGDYIYLTLDLAIQEKLETIMKQTLEDYGKERGSAIAMDPRDGSILAMVSLPSFDNNNFSGGIDQKTYESYTSNPNQPLFNRAISGAYPSGSTIKPLIAAAALEEGIITAGTTVLSKGGLGVGSWFFPDWQAGGHGLTDVKRSIAWSVNTFYYYIGGGYGDFKGMGLELLISYFKKFGLGAELGIDIPGENSGFIPSRDWKKNTLGESWYIGDTYNLSIGQGHLLVTPLQIANMTATIANGGTIYKPHLVREIADPEKKSIKATEIEELSEPFIGKENIKTVQQGMRDCVVYGSCRRLAHLPIGVAAKTGTAQWNQKKDDHAWFTSYAPYDNPEIVLTIMIEEGVAGSTIGAPIADAFYAWWGGYKKS